MPKFVLTPAADARLREALRQPATTDRGRELIKVLRALGESGATYRTVAERWSISQRKIRRAVSAYAQGGVESLVNQRHVIGRPGHPPEVRARVLALAAQVAPALSIKEIAQRTGVAVGVVFEWVKGLKRPDPRRSRVSRPEA